MKYSIAIHGGAGTMNKDSISQELLEKYHEALYEALQQGEKILKEKGSAIDAVQEAVTYLENNPLFNAGRGACFTYEGNHELDAAIMDGKNKQSGAVAGVTTIKNPVKAARQVLEKTNHLLLAGSKADSFAKENELEIVENSYFSTEERKQHWVTMKGSQNFDDAFKFGTVGAVAWDQQGNLAAATSTGGVTNKRYGRIGDTPILGAGNYADNKTCAISCTGKGEVFIENLTAYDISARMKYLNESLEKAVKYQIHESNLNADNAGGGVIAIDHEGNIQLQFNTNGMYRAYTKADQVDIVTGIFNDEKSRVK